VANLTLTIDEDLLRRARIRALERGTSVNAVVREFLEGYAGSEQETSALQALGALADRARASSGPGGRSWTRDGIHDRT
jgi:plasmid stability protein